MITWSVKLGMNTYRFPNYESLLELEQPYRSLSHQNKAKQNCGHILWDILLIFIDVFIICRHWNLGRQLLRHIGQRSVSLSVSPSHPGASTWPSTGRTHRRTYTELTHWKRDKMIDILQTTFSNALSWMKMYEFPLRFHWNLFLRAQLTIFQHWFR